MAVKRLSLIYSKGKEPAWRKRKKVGSWKEKGKERGRAAKKKTSNGGKKKTRMTIRRIIFTRRSVQKKKVRLVGAPKRWGDLMEKNHPSLFTSSKSRRPST